MTPAEHYVILSRVVRRPREEHPGCDIRLAEEESDPPRVSELDLVFYDCRVDGDAVQLTNLDCVPMVPAHSHVTSRGLRGN